ncbi:FAD-dependent oxidoreductase [Desulfonatronospira sp.]|uniref:NAD(P)/FAD-dependent oxidoreductase n=1 Tax=Desulfonatronospira sp. TaxID=1962951 RepID=UPI0025C58386|nr:FAD-dependent oxidoreductase [Desulfonatronospira sp.]
MNSHNQLSGADSLKIAVIGGGAAGMAASYYLGRRHRVDLFEAEQILGGHVQTVMAPDGDERKIPVDMGFIVFNDTNYPRFIRFLQDLQVQSATTDMSFSYSESHTGFAYSGSTLSGLFARRANIIDPRFWRMLFAIRSFCRNVTRDLQEGKLTGGTLGGYVRDNRYPGVLMSRYLSPMVRAIWSAESSGPEEFPLERFAQFFFNHGLLSFSGGPVWRYIPGGSHSYVQAFEKSFTGSIHTSSPVQAVFRESTGPVLQVQGQKMKYDALVLACHADTALQLLQDPDPEETACLSPWKYAANDVVMHTDDSFLPHNTRAWACWNVISHSGDTQERVNVHYWMNRLQRFQAQKNHVVTLNPRRPVPAEKTSRHLKMMHPQFTRDALDAQARFGQLQGVRGTYFCGSYHGNGFHEDAAASGMRVAELLGAEV